MRCFVGLPTASRYIVKVRPIHLECAFCVSGVMVKTDKTIVLVGIYEAGQLRGIEQQGRYLFPLTCAEAQQTTGWERITEMWLYAHKDDKRHAYQARFCGIKTLRECCDENLTCPNKQDVADLHYATFSVSPSYEVAENPVVILRLSDFIIDEKGKFKALESPRLNDLSEADRDCLPIEFRSYIGSKAAVSEPEYQLNFFPSLLKLAKGATAFKPNFTFIDLFAGCGGLSLGLERAGFTPLLVNELNADALETYLLNRRDEFPWLCDNNVSNVKDLVLNEALLTKFADSIKKDFKIDIFNGELDLICGGPPCQGFSGLGIRRSYSVEKKQLPSNYLYQDMAFLINRIRPKIFLFENVRGLLSARWTNDGTKGEIFQDVLKTFEDIGAYHIRYKLVHAKDYGVPQNRPRVLIVGLRKDLFNEPETHLDAVSDGFLPKPVGGYPSIEELLSDLIDPNYQRGTITETYPTAPQNEVQQRFRTRRDGSTFRAGDALSEMEYSNHSDMIVAKFTAMINNGGIIPEEFKTKKFAQKVLPRNWGKSGPTITACSAPDDYVHFSQPRSLTVREWARLQTFPDWYVFAGKRTTGGLRRAGNPREGIFDRELPKYTQIGNAVPVELAYNIGNHFVQLLKHQKKTSC